MKKISYSLALIVGLNILNGQTPNEADIDKQIAQTLTPLTLAEKLGIPFPPKSPSESVENIQKRVAGEVQKSVDEKFPASTKEMHEKVAREKYKLYKVGEKIEALRIRPTGRDAVISGVYQGVNKKGEHVVGSYPIPKVDTSEDVLVFLDPKVNQAKIDSYVRNRLVYFEEDKEKLKNQLTTELNKKYFKEAGYFEVNGNFFAAEAFLKKRYEEEKEKIKKSLTKVAVTAPNSSEVKKELEERGIKDDPFGAFDAQEKINNATEVSKVAEKSKEERKRISLFDASFYTPKK